MLGIVDIDLVAHNGREWLYTTSGAGGGVMALGVVPGANPSGLILLDQHMNPRPSLAGQSGTLATLEVNGNLVLMQGGIGVPTLGGLVIGANGTMGKTITLANAPIGVAEVTTVNVGGQTLVLTSERGSGLVRTHSLGADGGLVKLGRAAVATAKLPLADDVRMTTAVTEAGTFVLAASASSDTMVAWRLDAQGRLNQTDIVSARADGIGFSHVSDLRSIHAYGRDFVVIAAGQSSSLTVMELGPSGQLTPRDHVMDSLASRFGSVAALEIALVNGCPIVVAAGSDGGITALLVQPDGRLITLAVQADMTGLPLSDVSAIELKVVEDVVHIFAAGTREAGIAHLTLDLSQMATPIIGTALADTLAGGSGDDLLAGAAGNDLLTGGAGADILQDGAGADTLVGQAGADTFVLSRDGELDRISDFEPGIDRLDLSAWGRLYDLSAVLITRLSAGAVVLQYGAERLILTGRDGAWISDAALQAALEDTVFHLPIASIADRYDKLLVQARPNGSGIAVAVLSEDHGDARLSGTYGRDSLVGNSAANELFGYEGDDTLDGGAGADLMNGGTGNDVYLVDNVGDVIIDPGGIDEVRTSISLRVPVGIERATLLGTQNLSLTGGSANEILTGNRGANRIAGGNGNDWLRGGGGADTLSGGSGNDTMSLGLASTGSVAAVGGLGNDLYIADGAARIIELAGEGNDTLRSAVSATIPFAVEVLELTGSARDGFGNGAANTLIGNGVGNQLWGYDGNDTLDGRGGADTMSGGAGDDLYRVDSPSDVVVEAAGGGRDTVESSVTLTIPVQVEVLRLVGTGAINARGGARADWLIGNNAANQLVGCEGNDKLNGNGGNDTMYGGLGMDTMWGGAGDDSYIVDNIGDRVIEAAGAGMDRVFSTTSYWLPLHVEMLILQGLEDLLGIGNSGANLITGNDGNNGLIGLAGDDTLYGGKGNDTLSGDEGNDLLSGGEGIDSMVGGSGDDRYVVGQTGDVVIEEAGGGTDTVYTTISMTMPANVERLYLRGAAGLVGRGLGGSDWIIGDVGADTMLGGAGHDTLLGAAGNDVLSGEDGNDVLDGGLGRDRLNGGAGNDRLTGDQSGDVLSGGIGNDTYVILAGQPVIIEAAGGGTDTVLTSVNLVLAANVENANITVAGSRTLTGNDLANVLTGNVGNDVLAGRGGNDRLIGNAGDDRLLGEAGNDLLDGGTGVDRLYGGIGNDTLLGQGGADLLYGDANNDRLVGGDGRDQLWGGLGADSFVFDTSLGAENVDRIFDFRSVDDTLVLSRAVFPAVAPGWLSASAFTTGTVATTSAHRLIYNPSTGVLAYDPDGNGAAAAQPIVVLNPGTALHSGDILIA